jgi:ATP/maltotriose-dependent transcriptional regulator MalT
VRLLAGDHDAALAEARSAVEIAESVGNRWGESSAMLAVYRVELDRGELGPAMASIRRCQAAGELGGFAYSGVVTRFDLARIAAYAGDGERAAALADEALAVARERLPPAEPVAALAQAEARLAIGDLEGAREALDRVDGSLLPEPDRTFALSFAGLAGARLALAREGAEEADLAAAEAVELLHARDVEIMVAEALVILARARLAAGRLEGAERALAEASERAARLGERLPLWEALAMRGDLLDRRGAGDEAVEARRRAREVVARVAAGIDDEDLRRSFLARPDVVGLGRSSRT